ncbi:ABC transporter ATP-binding protein [Pseudoroseicyclus aestuarii]|uniref:Putative spermidine/putrescine transport system ATP-binding protein/thiamine transport system ATP-binding protein n=1 Tax=Pseudoroseicyclus aestuarii TaxID=1795041 RepID=A0A318SZE4_9RHOB|nr:ABC transporter ATP-binding protein [Pseudoroseicyclus aestuarii]PYE81404.1 putative spermidine/putrescine transport system ATP-binding protein/thiamine transport system ATP-binding protein [Pseudoroseicyclus aestuarii]
MSGLRFEDVTLRYPGAEAPALEGLTLDVPAGQRTVLLGPSGCGKTTALRIAAGLERQGAGRVLLDGAPLDRLPPERRGVVLVFQDQMLFPHMDVAANIGFGLRMRRRPAREIAQAVEAALERVQLSGLGARPIGALSGGQRQRVALARALVLRPRVLLLDEPLASLDAHLRGEMQALILDLQQQEGLTLLVVTHDQQEAALLGQRVGLMLKGRLRQLGPPEALWQRPVDAEVARFFGARRLVEGVSRAGVFDCALGRLALPEGAPEGKGHLMIRPEGVRLLPGAGADGHAARVVARQFLGRQSLLTLDLGGTCIEALVAPEDAPDIGAALRVALPPEALWPLPAPTTQR